jgi:hypothetical protein
VSATTFFVRRCLRLRFWLVFLGFLALERSVEASTCHVSERPALGIHWPRSQEESFTQISRLDDSPRPIQFRPSPCPGEDFGFQARSSFPGAFLALGKVFEPPISDKEHRFNPPDLRTPPVLLNPLERPPRDHLARPTL